MSTWRPARSILTLRDQIDATHPGRSTRSDGMLGDALHVNTASDHNPRTIRGENLVCAIDITSEAWTPAVVDALVASKDRRIKYLIYRRRIVNAETWQWRVYDGPNAHDLHFHLSVAADYCDDTRPWTISRSEDLSIVDAATKAYLEDFKKRMDNLFKATEDRLNTRIGDLDRNFKTRLAGIESKIDNLGGTE